MDFIKNKYKNIKKRHKQKVIIFIILFLLSKEFIINDYEIVIIYSLIYFLYNLYIHARLIKKALSENLLYSLKKEYKKLIILLLIIEKKKNQLIFFNTCLYYLISKQTMLIYRNIKIKLPKWVLYKSHLAKLAKIKQSMIVLNKKLYINYFINKFYTYMELYLFLNSK